MESGFHNRHANQRILRINSQYFNQVVNGSKDLDLRIAWPSLRKIRPCQEIWLCCANEGHLVQVVRIASYQSLEAVLEKESYKRFDATANSAEELFAKGKGFFDDRDAEKYGFLVFQLIPLD